MTIKKVISLIMLVVSVISFSVMGFAFQNKPGEVKASKPNVIFNTNPYALIEMEGKKIQIRGPLAKRRIERLIEPHYPDFIRKKSIKCKLKIKVKKEGQHLLLLSD